MSLKCLPVGQSNPIQSNPYLCQNASAINRGTKWLSLVVIGRRQESEIRNQASTSNIDTDNGPLSSAHYKDGKEDTKERGADCSRCTNRHCLVEQKESQEAVALPHPHPHLHSCPRPYPSPWIDCQWTAPPSCVPHPGREPLSINVQSTAAFLATSAGWSRVMLSNWHTSCALRKTTI